MSLSDRQVVDICVALVLLDHNGRGEVLSEFEAGLVREVGSRFCRDGHGAVVSDVEWPVIIDAIDAMSEGLALRGRLG